MKAGLLDRMVTILARTETQDATYGTSVSTWDSVATVPAQVQDVLPSRADRVAQEITISNRPTRVRMRWRDDVTQANRLEIDGLPYRIVAGPAMLGRRDGLELMAEVLSTEGDQP